MTKFIKYIFVFIIIFAAAEAPAAPIAEREILPSGLVLLHAERRSVPIVTVTMAVRAGAVSEPPEKAGLAYLTAALLNEGTEKRSSKQISEAIEFVGGSLTSSGGQDYATITLSILKKDIELGLDLLSDIVMNPAFKEEEISRKIKITKNSLIQQNEEPGAVASIAFMKAVFGDHPYSRQVQGSLESLDNISRQDIAGFHSAFFAPNNAIMSVAGDIGREELKSLLEKYLGNWKQKEIPEIRYADVEEKKSPLVIKINKDLTQASIIFGHRGISRSNPDYYAVSVMNYILGGGGFASRLMDNIRDNKGLAYDVHSYFAAGKFGGSFQAALQTKNGSANTAINEVLGEIVRIKTEYVSDKELQDAKSYLTGSFPLRIDSNAKIANLALAVEYFDLGLDYIDRYPSIINAVSKEDIQKAARKYLDPKNFILVVVGDLGKINLAY